MANYYFLKQLLDQPKKLLKAFVSKIKLKPLIAEKAALAKRELRKRDEEFCARVVVIMNLLKIHPKFRH